ncbi:pol protein [Cucumis melo var. makuwa]|uniref:Pol protein n=1 Tax=Cucumis melo var. makuwa TaxID=1194695 RepID=A0A5A7U4D4_CUCMM|nr:pol protein [Cucumis melo var. makuwa]TYK07756.1 pol protein [Cucumis melo var. makuwa]
MGPELVQSTNEAMQKIRSLMHTAQSRQKSYADVRWKDLEFDVGDKVFLKVAPMKGVLRFERRGKLSPRFVGPFEILERIGPVAYRLALPPSLSVVHDVFHVSMLRKYVPDPSHVVDYEPLEIDENLSYAEQPVEVLAREMKMLRNREIPLVKVIWRNHRVEEATWEREDDMRALAVSIPIVVGFTTPAYDRCDRPISNPPFCLTQPADCRLPLTPIVASDASFSSFCVLDATQNNRGIRELTLKFSGSTAGLFGDTLFTRVDSLGVDSSKVHNQVSGKGFLTIGPRIEAGNVVIHRGLYVRSATASCSLCAIVCKELFTDRHRCPDVLCIVVVLVGYVVNWNCLSVDFKVLMLDGLVWTGGMICASFGITRLICASFGITRLIGASFGITRLIRVSFEITRLVRVQRGARRMREGHMDASGFLYASADVYMLLVVFIVRSSHGLSKDLSLVQKVGSLHQGCKNSVGILTRGRGYNEMGAEIGSRVYRAAWLRRGQVQTRLGYDADRCRRGSGYRRRDVGRARFMQRGAQVAFPARATAGMERGRATTACRRSDAGPSTLRLGAIDGVDRIFNP